MLFAKSAQSFHHWPTLHGKSFFDDGLPNFVSSFYKLEYKVVCKVAFTFQKLNARKGKKFGD